ncbi:hypothetical protein ACNFH8_23855 [Pseudomonas sp. NY15436]|uniref:hypothetical protein n=1 Tax=Pseudomonas sp. NY15436 TaxID=3400359 RepID=UPI003A86E076
MTGPRRADLIAAQLSGKPAPAAPVAPVGQTAPVDDSTREVIDELFDRIRGICSGC